MTTNCLLGKEKSSFSFVGLLSLHFVWVLLDQVKEGKKEDRERKVTLKVSRNQG